MKNTFTQGDIVSVDINGFSHYAVIRQVKGTIVNVKPDGLAARDYHINSIHPINPSKEPVSLCIVCDAHIPVEERAAETRRTRLPNQRQTE